MKACDATIVAVTALYASSAGAAEAAPAAFGTWVGTVPPLIAILMALIFRQVIPALFAGVWIGAWAIRDFTLGGLGTGLLDAFQVYVRRAFADADHAAIMLFSFMIGGMVGIVSRNGGMLGVVEHVTRWAKSPRRANAATAGLGLAVFFDDYANTLVIGNTMRPVTDRLAVARAKLAYIVDSTAAPVACVALVTTWIGYEVGLIDSALEQSATISESAYSIFLNSLAYSFYPFLAMFFVALVVVTRRDFGPMLAAERRARAGNVGAIESGDSESLIDDESVPPVANRPRRAINAVVPVAVLVAGVLIGLYVTGYEPERGLREIVGEADSYRALMWGSLLGVLVAAALSLGQRILTLSETVEAWYVGARSMMLAMIILVLAWALAEVTKTLGTAEFLVGALGDGLSPSVVPALVFVLSAATAFATGSSWGTMGILMPLVIPIAVALIAADSATGMSVLYSSVACVLGGAVWGDHCSPISDTTILSSMASGCDHVEHVRTQLPYALLVGLVALFCGTLAAGYGLPWWLGYLVSAILLAIVIRFAGEQV